MQPGHSLELGTSLGLGSIAISLGNPDGHLLTVEGCPNTFQIAHKSFQKISTKKYNAVQQKV